MAEFKSEKKGSNIICRVSNVTPEMVCRYVKRLPKHKMTEEDFRDYMGPKWFQNEHQAPEQWGLYYIDGEYYYPRFNSDISLEEAERYLYGWIKRLIVINPYTRFKVVNDNRLVESIVKQLEINPEEHDLRNIISNIIDSDEPFVLNEILANAINNYSEVLRIDYDRENEVFYAYLLDNYKEILNTKYNMTKKEYFDSFNDIDTSAPLNEPLQQIFYGAPGTGKSYTTNEVTAQYPDTIRVTFHPDTDYASFVGTYKPTTTKEILYGLNGNVTVPLQINGKPIEASKIEYRFVKQAFLKAYIRAWKKMCGNKIVHPVLPKQLTFTIANAQYTITDADANGLRYTKNDNITKQKVQNEWNDLWSGGNFSIPTGSQSGRSVEQAIAKWIYENIENCTSKDFEKGWDKLIEDLRSNKSIKAKKDGGQTYLLTYKDATSVTFMTEKTKEKSRIRECYVENQKAVGAENGIIDILKKYDTQDFDAAWKKLIEDVHAGPAGGMTLTCVPQFLVIEEINRGNCAQIFGDLFQLLDRCGGFSEYPIEADEDIRKALLEDNPSDGLSFGSLGLTFDDDLKDYINKLYGTTQGIADKIAKGQVLVLPPNLYIWATMNTSDQSLFPIDSAFKRRWDWKYIPIKYSNSDWIIDIAGCKYSWIEFQTEINKRIFSATESEDKQLGDFFVKADNNNIISSNLLLNKVIFYLWNDVCKDGDGDIFKVNTDLDSKELDPAKNEDITFSKFFKETDLKLKQWMRYLGIKPLESQDDEEKEDEAAEEIETEVKP